MYSHDWTTDRVTKWLPYVQHLVGREGVNALEIGCFEGRSTVWMLENVLTHPISRIVCVDPFLGGSTPDLPNEYLTAFVTNTLPYQNKVRIVQAKSREIDEDCLRGFAGGYDLIYIDASHLPDETVYEANLAYRVANDSAVIVFDDYVGSLKDAVDKWLEPLTGTGRLEILSRDYQLLIKKTICPITTN